MGKLIINNIPFKKCIPPGGYCTEYGFDRKRNIVKCVSIIIAILLCSSVLMSVSAEENAGIALRNEWYQKYHGKKVVQIEPGTEEIPWFEASSIFEYAEKLIIPASVKRIAERALSRTNLKEIIIEEGTEADELLEIGDCAFRYCDNLKKLQIPSRVKSIGARAFGNCMNLKEVYVADGVEKIDYTSFLGCPELTELRLPSAIQLNGPVVVNFAPGTDVIMEGLYEDCDTIEKVFIPASVTRIEDKAFAGCKNLKEIVFESRSGADIKKILICEEVFRGCDSLEKVRIPSFVTGLEGSAFYECGSLKEVYIEDGVEEIADSAFTYCPKLTDLRLPTTLKRGELCIGLNGCDSFRKLVIPDGVVYISWITCPALERIEISKSVKDINFYSLSKSSKLAEIYVDPANPVFSAKDNCLIMDRHDIVLMGCNVARIPEDKEIGFIDSPWGEITPWALCADNFRTMKVPSNIICFQLGDPQLDPDVIYLEENTYFQGSCMKPTEIYYNGTMSNAFNHIRIDAFNHIGGAIVHCTDGDINWEVSDPRGVDLNDMIGLIQEMKKERGWSDSPVTGDSGVIWVAAVSVLSLLGACIFIRKRTVSKNKR